MSRWVSEEKPSWRGPDGERYVVGGDGRPRLWDRDQDNVVVDRTPYGLFLIIAIMGIFLFALAVRYVGAG